MEAEVTPFPSEEGSSCNGEAVNHEVVGWLSRSSGIYKRMSASQDMIPGEAISSEQSDQDSRRIIRRDESNRGKPLGFLAANLFDEYMAKKLQWLKRVASVNQDGTVQLDVPVNIRPKILDIERADAYNEATDDVSDSEEIQHLLPLHIAILIVGTRGDVQPFVAIGKRLKEHGHRVRLATHANFKDFVLEAGLEFYRLGGDPKVLAWYMVKNKGILPSEPSEVQVQRKELKDVIFSLLSACTESDPETGIPFKVDAIIANPPACGHMHVAEALKVPIHVFFTMPWTPTNEFPHPLSRVKHQAGYRISYQIIDALMWLAMRDLINDFRKKKLRIRPVTYLHGANIAAPQVPFGYIWSPHLVPKPRDWGPEIDVVGFCFLDLASGYDPPESLLKWLHEGEKPIYIGFGSLPIEEPRKMTEIIVEALETTGQRGIISKGWGGLGDLAEPKEYVYLIDSCPHDWLFPRCSAVIHHGGAGTTAAGLRVACPTTIVPFFGDQMFWGEQVAARGVGPAPIPAGDFSLQKLVDAILFMEDPKVKERSLQLADAMGSEDGVNKAVKVFYKHFSRRMSDSQRESIGRHARLLNAIDSVYRIRRNIGYEMGRSHGCADEIRPFEESVVSSLELLAEASTLRIESALRLAKSKALFSL